MTCPECEKISDSIRGSGYEGDCFGVDYRCQKCKKRDTPPRIGRLRDTTDYWVEVENAQGDRAFMPASSLEKPQLEHHVWCNFWEVPQETCEMCKSLYKKYPYSTEEESRKLAAKHFPLATERK